MVQGIKGNTFQWPDLLVLFAVLAASVSIGIYSALSGQKQRTTSEYLLANRSLKWLPVGLSILVTFQSAVLYLGVPAEIYVYGTSYLLFHVAMATAVVIVATVFVPLLYPLHLTSTFEYLERRYKSKITRVIGSILGSLNMILYMGVVIYAAAAALEADKKDVMKKMPVLCKLMENTFMKKILRGYYLHHNLITAILSFSGFHMWAGILLITAVATFYTTIGGLRAVIWTDVFQFIIMMTGLLAVLIQGFLSQGGFMAVWESNKAGGRVDFSSLDPDPRVRHTLWSLLVGGTFTWLANIAVNQSTVQRFSSVPSLSAAKWASLTGLPGFVILGVLASFMGMLVFAYFQQIGCDPLAANIVSSPNQLVPLYVVEVFDFLPGFSGLFIAALLCAALSSVSSCVNGLAAIAWEDMLKWKLHNISDLWAARIVKISAGCYGLLGMVVAYIASILGGPATQIVLSFFGASGGPLLGMFLLGCTFPGANWIGASLGAVAGFTLCMWIAVGAKSLPPTQRLPAVSITGCFNRTKEVTLSNMSMMDFPYNVSITEHSSGQITDENSTGLSGLYHVSYLWYSMIGVCVVFIVGLLVSLLTGCSSYEEISPDLLLPCVNKFYKHRGRSSESEPKDSPENIPSAASGLPLLPVMKGTSVIPENGVKSV